MDAPFDRGRARLGIDVNPERWSDVSRLFSVAVDLDPAARDAYLVEACSGDAALRAAVESLLVAHDAAGSFGDKPVVDAAAAPKRLAPGDVLGSFRIESLLGAGGMGEVYRAYDTKLRRSVALKVLPDSFAADPDRRIRFEEEAQALAALNHPHIGAIYGIEDSGDVAALVLELVDGVTLAERLAVGPLPFEEITTIARQLADGLEAAHERGIVHRDFKPANIKITTDGTVKILDFGLAKAAGEPAPMKRFNSPFDSPAPSRDATAAGVIVGTAAYMSPEQARGGRVDKRADIWAFGCVLFEMCALRPPFAARSVGQILSAVMEREPDWRQLRPGTPPAVSRVLRRALIKDPKLRMRDIGEARITLASGDDPEVLPGRNRSLAIVAGAVVLASLIALLAVFASRPTAPPSKVVFEVPPPREAAFRMHPATTFFALSPDGARLAFLTSVENSSPGLGGIWIREMTEIDAKLLVGTEKARALFWSHDGLSLAFVAEDKLKRYDFGAGKVLPICDLPKAPGWHGTWGTRDVILLANGDSTEIRSVAASGGTPLTTLLKSDESNGERRVHWPWFLPGGTHFLYTSRRADKDDGQLRLGSLDGKSQLIMSATSNAQWVDPDLVIFARDGVLMGQRVDLNAVRSVGAPFTIAERVNYFATTSRAMFSTSRTGDVAYHTRAELAQIVLTDLAGNELRKIGPPADYSSPSARLSPDESSLVTAHRQSGSDAYVVWRYDVTRREPGEPLTQGRASTLAPIWIDKGRGIVFAADSEGAVPNLFRRDLVTGHEEQLLPPDTQRIPAGVFPDGSIAYLDALRGEGFQMFRLPMNPRGSPSRLRRSVRSISELELSPDGLAMAYSEANDVSRDLYVSLVNGTSPRLRFAQGVRRMPRWSHDGAYLYFVGRDDTITRVPVQTAPQLTVQKARPLFKAKGGTSLLDISSDEKLLLMVPLMRDADQPIVVGRHAIRPPK